MRERRDFNIIFTCNVSKLYKRIVNKKRWIRVCNRVVRKRLEVLILSELQVEESRVV